MSILKSEMGLLRTVPLFAGIEPSRLKLIAYTSESINYLEGQVLCRQGDPGDSAYVLLQGSAEVSIATRAGDYRIAVLGPGDIVGEIAILCDTARTATVTAKGPVSVLRVRKECFVQLLKQFPEISKQVMRGLAERLAHTNEELARASDRVVAASERV